MFQEKLKEVFTQYERSYEIFFVSLYGSQNYGLSLSDDTYQSDLDYKMVVFPDLKQLIENEPTKELVVLENGQLEIKDLKTFSGIVSKLNPAYLESIFTENIYVNPKYEEYFTIFKLRIKKILKLSRKEFISACLGMSLEKQKALTHPYPTIKHKIDKWGYDGKQLHHQERLRFLAIDFLKTDEYKMMLTNQYLIDYLLKIKRNELTLEEALRLSAKNIDLFTQLRREVPNSDKVAIGMQKDRIEQIVNDAYFFSIRERCRI